MKKGEWEDRSCKRKKEHLQRRKEAAQLEFQVDRFAENYEVLDVNNQLALGNRTFLNLLK